jgi:hypothetical protein
LSPETAYAELNKLNAHPILDGLFTAPYSLRERSLDALRTYVVGADGQLVPIGEFSPVPDF